MSLSGYTVDTKYRGIGLPAHLRSSTPSYDSDMLGFIKHRWFYEIYCKSSNFIIGRSHKRPRECHQSDSFIDHYTREGYDFFNPMVCGCPNCSAISNLQMDEGLTLRDIALSIGVFKGVKR